MNQTIEIHEEKKDRGFTLIELLIVIVILGILATVTVFAVGGITDRGQQSACAADAKTGEVAVSAFLAKNGANPAPAGDRGWDPLITEPNVFLNNALEHHTLGAAGAITPTVGGKCVPA